MFIPAKSYRFQTGWSLAIANNTNPAIISISSFLLSEKQVVTNDMDNLCRWQGTGIIRKKKGKKGKKG